MALAFNPEAFDYAPVKAEWIPPMGRAQEAMIAMQVEAREKDTGVTVLTFPYTVSVFDEAPLGRLLWEKAMLMEELFPEGVGV